MGSPFRSGPPPSPSADTLGRSTGPSGEGLEVSEGASFQEKTQENHWPYPPEFGAAELRDHNQSPCGMGEGAGPLDFNPTSSTRLLRDPGQAPHLSGSASLFTNGDKGRFLAGLPVGRAHYGTL